VAVGLTVDIKGDTSNLDSALDKSKGNVGGFGSALGGLVNPATLAAGGIVAVGAALFEMTKGAAADRDEADHLTQTIIAAGAATGDYTQQVEDAIAAGQDKAFTDSDVRAGLESLVTATGDVEAATHFLNLAEDVARKSHVDLKTASDAVAKAYQGQDGALRKLIPGIAKTNNSVQTLIAVQHAATGQADLFAKSSEGMGMRASDAFSEIGETIGGAFLPVMDEVLPALLPVIKQFAQLISTILPLLIPLVKVLASALGLVAKVLSTLVGWLVKLVTWLSNAIGKLGAFLDKINPLKGIKLPSLPFLNASAAGAPAGASTRGARSSGGTSSGLTVNVYGALDPEATARQIRRILEGHAARTGSGVAI
jgi:hypothetical protein